MDENCEEERTMTDDLAATYGLTVDRFFLAAKRGEVGHNVILRAAIGPQPLYGCVHHDNGRRVSCVERRVRDWMRRNLAR